MTQEQIKFIEDNADHFDLVIKHNQNFQRSHELTKVVLEIHGGDISFCSECVREAYVEVWENYLKSKKHDKDKGTK